jgi:hypothetical protein
MSYNDYPESFDPVNKNQFFNNAVDRAVSQLGGRLLAQRVISDRYYTGRDFVVALKERKFIRSRFILVGNRLYQVMAGASENDIYSDKANAYFESFSIATASERNWYNLIDNSFSLKFPGEPVHETTDIPSEQGEINLNMYSYEDNTAGVLFFLSINNYPESFSFKNLKSFYDGVLYSAMSSMRANLVKEKNVTVGELKAKYAELSSTNGSVYQIYFILKDKQLYQVMATGAPATLNSGSVEYFFDSMLVK